MFEMSFSNGTLNREKLKEIIDKTDKQILYTYGLCFRHPTIYKVKVTKEQARKIIDTESLLDATEYPDYIHLNAFSENDMW